YLPSSLQGQVFYQPSDRGFESAIQTQVARRREAQLAALLEGTSVALPEVLTFGPVDSAQERWLQRTLGQAGDRLGEVRDRLFALAAPQRHHVVLDLNAGSGLLTWEAVRQTPEGSVIACVRTTTDADAMTQQAAALPELARPLVLQTSFAELPTALEAQASDVRFDHIIGRNALMREVDKAGIVRSLSNWLQPNGTVTLAESIPYQAQRLYQLLNPAWLSDKLYQKLVKAEEAIYTQPDDPMVNWDAPDLQVMFEAAGFIVALQVEPLSTEMLITAALVDRWFAANSVQSTYVTHLSHHLSQAELTKVRSAFTRLVNQTVKWRSTIAFVQAHR
ncbi:MAG TPA: AAA family ATPase, partial [Crinalium sp.]